MVIYSAGEEVYVPSKIKSAAQSHAHVGWAVVLFLMFNMMSAQREEAQEVKKFSNFQSPGRQDKVEKVEIGEPKLVTDEVATRSSDDGAKTRSDPSFDVEG